jgi:hypothetical protein
VQLYAVPFWYNATVVTIRGGLHSPRQPIQAEEFEKPDLGEDIRAAGGLRPIRKTLPTSIVLEQDLVDKLREKGAKRGLGYQTMLKLIAREHVDEC